MNKILTLAAASALVAAPLTAIADQAVVLETDKSTQGVNAFLAASPALAAGAVVVIAGVLFAVVSDSSSSSTTLVAVED